LAHGAMLALRGEGIDVPGEISVVGFGGWEEPITGVGTLASASWPVRELTESAVDTLLDHIEGAHGRDLVAEAPVSEVLYSRPLPGPRARLGGAPAVRQAGPRPRPSRRGMRRTWKTAPYAPRSAPPEECEVGDVHAPPHPRPPGPAAVRDRAGLLAVGCG